MAEFMMVTRGKPEDWNKFSPEEVQRVMERYYEFVNRLKSEGRFKGGSALRDGGHLRRPVHEAVAIDGPYPETKEAMTGYLLFEAKDRLEALEVAKGCPALTHGEQVEVLELSNNS